MFPVIPLAGIGMGFFSPSEVGVFTYFYSVFVGAFIYKKLIVKSFITALGDSTADIDSIMMIVSLTALFGYGIPIDKVPQKMTTFITGITTNPSLVLVLIIILLIFVGIFMKGPVVTLLLTSVPLPIYQSVGTDPMHPELLMCIIVIMGVNTPPVGMSMHTVNTILDCSL